MVVLSIDCNDGVVLTDAGGEGFPRGAGPLSGGAVAEPLRLCDILRATAKMGVFVMLSRLWNEDVFFTCAGLGARGRGGGRFLGSGLAGASTVGAFWLDTDDLRGRSGLHACRTAFFTSILHLLHVRVPHSGAGHV